MPVLTIPKQKKNQSLGFSLLNLLAKRLMTSIPMNTQPHSCSAKTLVLQITAALSWSHFNTRACDMSIFLHPHRLEDPSQPQPQCKYFPLPIFSDCLCLPSSFHVISPHRTTVIFQHKRSHITCSTKPCNLLARPQKPLC